VVIQIVKVIVLDVSVEVEAIEKEMENVKASVVEWVGMCPFSLPSTSQVAIADESDLTSGRVLFVGAEIVRLSSAT